MALKERRQLSVYEAIYHRRMAWKFEDKPVPASTIEQMLDAAVWAPNHRLTEPWRFFVLDKDSPTRRLAADMARQTMLDRSGDETRADAGRDKMLETPCLMYVYSVPGRDRSRSRRETMPPFAALSRTWPWLDPTRAWQSLGRPGASPEPEECGNFLEPTHPGTW